MSELQLKKLSRELIDQAERSVIPKERLGQWVDEFFVERLKRAEMEHAEVDPKLYEGLRSIARSDVVPRYQKYRAETERIEERRSRRKLWQYVLGTAVLMEVVEGLLTRGRSILPQVMIPTAIFYSFVGFIIYSAAQYFDDLLLARARKRFENALEGLDNKVQTDVEYDNRRQLLQADVMHAEALEILTHYEEPAAFWADYSKVREADPTSPSAVRALGVVPFEKFLRYHVTGAYSEAARQQRFNRLFLEAQEVFVSRDREGYVVQHLKRLRNV